jgi:hypothetical protein
VTKSTLKFQSFSARELLPAPLVQVSLETSIHGGTMWAMIPIPEPVPGVPIPCIAPTPSSCRRWPPTPLDSTKSCLSYTNRRSYGHEATSNVRGASAVASEHWFGSLYRNLTAKTTAHPARRSGQPSPDGSLEAHEREDFVALLSPPSSQPSPRASLLG